MNNGTQLTIAQELAAKRPQFAAVLKAKNIDEDYFIRIVMTAVQRNPELLDCQRHSLLLACQQAAEDGLLPDGKEGVLVIRWTKRGNAWAKIVGWQPMIAGIRKKVLASGEIIAWETHEVCENDAFEYELGDEPFVRHKPVLRNRGEIIAAYSICTLKSGYKSHEIMSIEQMHAVRDAHSDGWKAYSDGKIKTTPWLTDEGEMCRKTVAHRHFKSLPTASEVETALRRGDSGNGEESAVAAPPLPRRTLNARLAALAGEPNPPPAPIADEETGEIKQEQESEAGASPAPASDAEGSGPSRDAPEAAAAAPVSAAAASPSVPDKSALLAELNRRGDEAAAKGVSVLTTFLEFELTLEEDQAVTTAMWQRWQEAARKADRAR